VTKLRNKNLDSFGNPKPRRKWLLGFIGLTLIITGGIYFGPSILPSASFTDCTVKQKALETEIDTSYSKDGSRAHSQYPVTSFTVYAKDCNGDPAEKTFSIQTNRFKGPDAASEIYDSLREGQKYDFKTAPLNSESIVKARPSPSR
jgi:hypothetical protein